LSKSSRSFSGRSARPSRLRREKHIAFFRLVEACGEAECPICHLVRLRVEKYFDGLLYEKVNDPELRRRFRTAGGFCNPHSFQFMGYHDGLAGSILYRDLLGTWLDQQLNFPVQIPSGVLPGCPVCRERAETEETYLVLLAKFLDDEQLKQALLSSDGLCLPHLGAIANWLRGDKRPVPAWLMAFQRDIVKRLVADLSIYLDSCNFSLGNARPSLTRQQELAWQRALHKAAGFPAITEKG
jgi:hypothetical protein